MIRLLTLILDYIFGKAFNLNKKNKAYLLSEIEKESVKQYGIIHFTNKSGYESIRNTRIILKTQDRGLCWKNNCELSSYFVLFNLNDINTLMGIKKVLSTRGKVRNRAITNAIVIKNFLDEQLSRMRIRRYDNAIIYEGDFSFADFNTIDYIDNSQMQELIKKVQYNELGDILDA